MKRSDWLEAWARVRDGEVSTYLDPWEPLDVAHEVLARRQGWEVRTGDPLLALHRLVREIRRAPWSYRGDRANLLENLRLRAASRLTPA